MERRRIEYIDGEYHLLKLRKDGTNRFNNYGKRKSLKAIRSIIEKKIYDLEFDAISRKTLNIN